MGQEGEQTMEIIIANLIAISILLAWSGWDPLPKEPVWRRDY